MEPYNSDSVVEGKDEVGWFLLHFKSSFQLFFFTRVNQESETMKAAGEITLPVA